MAVRPGGSLAFPALHLRPVMVEDFFQVHPQLCHLLKALGGNEVSPLAFFLFLLDPPQLRSGLDKDAPERKRIDRPEMIFFLTFWFHLAPFLSDFRRALAFRLCEL
jgi:hypothetical protein